MRKLRDAVKKVAQEKGVEITSGLDGRLRNWDRELEKTKDAEGAMKKIESEFKYNFNREDYEEIKRAIR